MEVGEGKYKKEWEWERERNRNRNDENRVRDRDRYRQISRKKIDGYIGPGAEATQASSGSTFLNLENCRTRFEPY